MNPVTELLLKHRSIRRYKSQPIEKEKLDIIVRCAQAAATWCNGQYVSIVVVKDEERKKRIQECCFNQECVGQCPAFLVFCADYYRTNLIFEKYGDKEGGAKVPKKLDNLLVGCHDVGIALQNAIVAAESMGLGIVPIGGVRIRSLDIIKELKLPKYVIPVVGLCVGYPDDNPEIKPRLPPRGVCFEETYDTTHLNEAIDEYDKVYKEYLSSRSSNSRDSNWSKSIFDINNSNIPNQDYEMLKQQGFIEIENKEKTA